MKFVVTRQHQWPEGKLMVELSEGGIDYTNPDALVHKYSGEFEEFEDVCEAAETAISILEAWKKDAPEEEIFLGVGCTMGMTMPFDECTPNELKKWAENVKKRGTKCELCDNMAIEGGTLCEDCSEIKCKVCGGTLIMGDCATECISCGASVDPDTGEPYRHDDGQPVQCGYFGGRHIP